MDAASLRKIPKKRVDYANLVWTLKIQGPLTELSSTEIDCKCRRATKRGPIVGLSAAARLRMLKTVATIDWNAVKCGVFITLTWPCESWPKYAKLGVQARSQFIRDIENYLHKKIHVLWRLEWKRRKTGTYRGRFLPHFHLIVPNVPFIDKKIVNAIWKRCVQAKGKVITWIDRLEDERKHAVYIAKYCSKAPPSAVLDCSPYLNTPGRHWGRHRRELLPVHPVKEFQAIPEYVARELRRRQKERWPAYDLEFDAGFSVFGKFGERFSQAAYRLCLDAGLCPV